MNTLKKRNLWLIAIMLLPFLSCELDETNLSETENVSENSLKLNATFGDEVELKNGILNFKSHEIFLKTVEKLSELEEKENELMEIFDPYYEDGFIPLFPFYNEGDEKKIIDFF